MPVQELRQRRAVALADFTEHPAGRFMHQIVPVRQEKLRKLQRIGKIAVPE